MSKILSIMPAPFSNCMEYEKPEQPPPTTPIRKPAGTGFCCAMISLTLVTAVGVKLTGNLGVVSTFGVVVVAIACISLKLNELDCSSIIHRLLLILLGFLVIG